MAMMIKLTRMLNIVTEIKLQPIEYYVSGSD